MTEPIKQATARSRAFRERKAAAELAEVRGIFAPPKLHAKIKAEAAKLIGPDASPPHQNELDYTLIDAVTNEELPRTRATDVLVKQLMLEQKLDPTQEWGPLPLPDDVSTDSIDAFLFINCPTCL